MSHALAINGFGRIGRLTLRAAIEMQRSDVHIAAIHSRGTSEQLAHLLKYDSAQGRMNAEITAMENSMMIAGQKIPILSGYEMTDLPWGDMGIDVVLECTGKFNTKPKCLGHLEAGAKRVLVSAPCKQADATVVYGVNHGVLRPAHQVVSNASCTTNCAATVCKVLNDELGIESTNMTTIHAATGDQPTVDSRHKNSLRRSRAAFQSMIPTTTGAGRTMCEVIPELKGRMDGTAMRVPVLNVSVIDLTAQVRTPASIAEINNIMRKASEGELRGVLAYSEEELVSCDFMHHPASAIFDATGTKVFGKDLLRVMAWYDNEWAFAIRMLDVASKMATL
ncbi:MAG: type I glyceraldehyde-3-phosphate dehydrogenase [Alphaproteobacteria bacterium]|nr:type I glyceraldehyde-3-phosphate dehydrogenase [Alphaproteobacteria bacterium]